VAQASSYYPLKLCQAVAKAMAYTWKRQEALVVNNLNMLWP
jgi:hypothetical protein